MNLNFGDTDLDKLKECSREEKESEAYKDNIIVLVIHLVKITIYFKLANSKYKVTF